MNYMDNPKVSRTSAEYVAAENYFRSLVQQANQLDDVMPVVLDIDNAMAQVLLDYNEGNRNIKPSKLDQYKRDMVEGRYKTNGESLIVAKSGRLNDGQHRLHAMLDTGLTFRSVVSFGVSPDAIETIDLGSARSAGDALSIDDVPNAATTSSLLKLMVSYERTMKEGKVPAGTIQLGSNSRVTVPEIRQRFINSENADRALITDAATYANSHSKSFQGLLTPQQVAFTFWLLGSINQQAAVGVLDKIRTQMGFTPGDPVFAAYTHLKKMKPGKNTNDRISVVIYGWNLMRRGKTVNRFSLPDVIQKPR